jgi:hypothetical protein
MRWSAHTGPGELREKGGCTRLDNFGNLPIIVVAKGSLTPRIKYDRRKDNT